MATRLSSQRIDYARSVSGDLASRVYRRLFTGFNFTPEEGDLGGVKVIDMSSEQERAELDARARRGETVIPGGTGGKSLEAQEHLAEGRSRGGQTRREQLGTEGYQEMGRKGGLSTGDQSGGEHAAEERSINIDKSKFRTKS